jgi:hypothetical protein
MQIAAGDVAGTCAEITTNGRMIVVFAGQMCGEQTKSKNIQLLAVLICYLCSVPLLFPKSALILENIGDEKEQIQRRADHWFHQAS